MLMKQADMLAELIKNARHVVAFTGAGISTSAGIPDFRGPNGVWTLRAQGREAQAKTSVHKACPTRSHMALVALQDAGLLHFVISQNVDGLHRRSGIRPDRLAELHGNTNLETCDKCGKEYLRDFGCRNHANHVYEHATNRRCSCGGVLRDSIVNFGESLPAKAIQNGYKHSRAADLVLVLGSSLTVSPANDMPRVAKTENRAGLVTRLVICNLQKTPLDQWADIRIFGRTDDLMVAVMKQLNLPIPDFTLTRYVQIEKRIDSEGGVRLAVKGIEPDSTPASILSAVKINCGHNVWQQKGEPFEMDIAANRLDNETTVTLWFMGHYNEPVVSIPLRLNSVTKTTYRLQFLPRQGGPWSVQQVSNFAD